MLEGGHMRDRTSCSVPFRSNLGPISVLAKIITVVLAHFNGGKQNMYL